MSKDFDKYGLGLNVNSDWEENWKTIISTDFDYDSDFLIRLMTHKLKLMLDYFTIKAEQVSNSEFETDNDLNDILISIKLCYLRGLKILTYNYSAEADELFKNYGSMIWLSEDFKDKNYTKWKRLTRQAERERNTDIKEFFKLIAKDVSNWWV